MEKTLALTGEGFFAYRRGRLFAEDVSAAALAERYGTPLYVYSAGMIARRAEEFAAAFARISPLVCYSVKANGNPAILSLLAKKGFGMDVVSGGELKQALAAGVRPGRIVYAGVGKTAEEIALGLSSDILCFNVESIEELTLLDAIARKLGKRASCNLRVNLDIDVDTHHYTKTAKKETKFGIPVAQFAAIAGAKKRYRAVAIRGIHCHLGSQIKKAAPLVEAIGKIRGLADACSFSVEFLDLGGGIGIPYAPGDRVEPIRTFGTKICAAVRKHFPDAKIIFEPGRFIVGNAGILLARVIYPKRTGHKNFLILDAGMNDLIRPALYQSYHHIIPAREAGTRKKAAWDVVGPICESGDFFGKDRRLPADMRSGDLVAVCSAGAYGFSMSSNYNGRPKSAEVLVNGARHRCIRKRESV